MKLNYFWIFAMKVADCKCVWVLIDRKCAVEILIKFKIKIKMIARSDSTAAWGRFRSRDGTHPFVNVTPTQKNSFGKILKYISVHSVANSLFHYYYMIISDPPYLGRRNYGSTHLSAARGRTGTGLAALRYRDGDGLDEFAVAESEWSAKDARVLVAHRGYNRQTERGTLIDIGTI